MGCRADGPGKKRRCFDGVKQEERAGAGARIGALAQLRRHDKLAPGDHLSLSPAEPEPAYGDSKQSSLQCSSLVAVRCEPPRDERSISQRFVWPILTLVSSLDMYDSTYPPLSVSVPQYHLQVTTVRVLASYLPRRDRGPRQERAILNLRFEPLRHAWQPRQHKFIAYDYISPDDRNYPPMSSHHVNGQRTLADSCNF